MAGGINPFGFAVTGGGAFVPRAMPAPVGDAPFGFAFTPPVGPSKWDRVKQALWETNLNAPVRGIYNLMNTPYDVLMGADSPEKQAAVESSFDAAGGVTVGSAMIPKPSNAMAMGIKAYHGSPHSFDKFDMSKIGTGEGAQAYGHGLYFADSEGIAQHYRDALSSGSRGGDAPHFKALGNKPLKTVHPDIQHDIAEKGIPAIDARLAEIDDILKNEKQNRRFFGDAQTDEMIKVFGAEKDELNALKAAGDTSVNKGHMYEVSINADPNAFLDWDKPLSEQPEVMAKLKPLLDDPGVNQEFIPRYTGKDIMSMDGPLANYIGKTRTPGDYRGVLKSEGIPGIKYLDAGSRGMTPPTVKPKDGKFEVYWGNDPRPVDTFPTKEAAEAAAREIDGRSRNYVVFDDKLISIVRKYGIAGASAMLGYNLLDGLSDAQAAELKKIEGK